MLSADRDAGGAIFDMKQRAGDVRRHELERLIARVDLRRQNVAQHRWRHRACLAAEQIKWRAPRDRGADRGVTECNADLGDVVAVDELLVGLVLGVDVIDVPGEAVEQVQSAPDAAAEVPGVDVLVE
jgi:hypothetical protein